MKKAGALPFSNKPPKNKPALTPPAPTYRQTMPLDRNMVIFFYAV
jgi:hypothetical protein